MKKIIGLALILFTLVGCTNGEKSSKIKAENVGNNNKVAVINQDEKEERNSKMKKSEYELALNKAKKEKKMQQSDNSSAEKVTISAFTDSFTNIAELEANATLGIQGVVVESNPHIDIDEKLERSEGNTRVVVLVNEVIYGDQSLVGQKIVIFQAGGYVTKKQMGIQEKFLDMSEIELNEEVLTSFNGTEPLELGTELVAYLSLISENNRKLDYPYYDFLGISLSIFDKNESTGKYEQVNELDKCQ